MKSIEELQAFGKNQLRQLNTHFESGNYDLAFNYAREVMCVSETLMDINKWVDENSIHNSTEQ